MNRRIFLLVFLLMCFLRLCYSGTIDPDNSDLSYIEYGKYFSYVGKLEGTYFNGDCFVASAVAIDDHNILTAAHIVCDIKNATIKFGDHSFIVKKFVTPKSFKPNGSGFADIAIGHSKKPFGLNFYPPLYVNTDEMDKVCCICGFGGSGNFLTGVTFFDTKKRAGSNVIKYVQKDLLICDASDEFANNRTSLEFLIANGDSGGGLFIDGKLAGINSGILSNNKKATSTYKDHSGHTRVSNFIDWINKNKFISSP